MVTITPSLRETIYNPVSMTTDFPTDFPIFGRNIGEVPATDIEVEVNGALRTDFTIVADFVDGISTNAIVRMSGGVTGTVIVRGRRSPRRTDEYKPGAPLKIEDHNYSLNRVESELQEVRRDADRVVGGMRQEREERIAADIALNDRVDKEIVDRTNADDALEALIGQQGTVAEHFFESNTSAKIAPIKPTFHSILTGGGDVVGDGRGGLYVDTNTGSLDKFTNNVDGRTWYRVIDVRDDRVFPTPVEYEGVVATGCKVLTQTYSVNKWITTASRHSARGDIHGLRVAFANWYVNDAQAEVSPGSPIFLRAAIEYPRGVVTPLRFAGVGNTTINAGETKFTDWLPEISIPDGETFFIRTFVECPNGIIYSNHVPGYMQAGETVAGAPDYTNFSTPLQTSPFNLGYAPLAILGLTKKSTIVLLGDSIAEGYDDTTDYYRGNGGYMLRSLEEKHAIISLAKSGDSAFKWLTNNSKRAALIQFTSHMVIEYGSNDLTSGRSAAALQADIETIINAYKKPTHVCTVGPCTNSSNGWIDAAGQTPYASEPQRLLFNNVVRAGAVKGAIGYFDVADALETFRNSGLWVTNGVANYYTDDGVHPSPKGHDRVQALGAVSTSRIKRFNEVDPRPATAKSLYSLGGTGTFVTPALLRKALGVDQVSFTPTIAGAITPGVGTYSLQAGVATKIGRLVYFLAMVNWTNHTGFGPIQIKGLPWKNAMSGAPVSLYYGGLAYTSGLAIGARVGELQDYIEIFFTGPGATPGTLSIENNQGPALLHVSGVYFADTASDYLW